MSQTVKQIYDNNPSTTFSPNTLIYGVNSPYSSGTDTAIKTSDFLNQIQFSPANTIYVATNGSVSGDGSFGNPYALPSQGIAACVSGGVSATNPYLLVVQEGPYTEVVDLSLCRPGLWSVWADGVRLTMTNNNITQAGWSGVQGLCGIRGLAPLDFATVDLSGIPSDATMGLILYDNNWNAVNSAAGTIYSLNKSSNSFLIANNCDLLIQQAGPGLDVTYNNCRGNVSHVNSGDYRDCSIYLNGGTYFTSYAATSEITSGAVSAINTFLTSAFVGAADLYINTVTGSNSISYTPGQIGQLGLHDAGGSAPTVNCQVEGRQVTPDATMLNWFYQQTVEAKHTGAGKLNGKLKDSGGTVYNFSVCSPINFRVTQGGTAQTIPNNTETPLTLDTEAFDVGGYFSTNAYTPKMPGKYQFSLNLTYVPPGAAIATVQAYIYKNGLLAAQASKVIAVGEVANLSLGYLDDFDGSSDNVTVYTKISGNAGGSLDINNAAEATYFCGFRVSD